jgi:hypothetical protein
MAMQDEEDAGADWPEDEESWEAAQEKYKGRVSALMTGRRIDGWWTYI